ncbi:MAG TPA: hypothetical protein VF251_00520 [Pyrinomonadaceae bacterium]
MQPQSDEPTKRKSPTSTGATGAARTTTKRVTDTATNISDDKDDDLIQHAKDTTNKVVDQVQQQADSTVNRQKNAAATELQKVAQAVRQMGDGLRNDEQSAIAQYAAQYGNKAAETIEKVTNYLRENDARDLVREIEDFGRRRPAIIVGGAFLVGLAGARFLKSSTRSNQSRFVVSPQQNVNTSATTSTF